MKSLPAILLAGLLLALSPFAPAQTDFVKPLIAGQAVASQFNWQIGATVQSSAGGSGVITFDLSYIVLPDSTQYTPWQTGLPVIIQDGAATETVNLTGVSCSSLSGQPCTATANFQFAHDSHLQVSSGSYGLQEAINLLVTRGGGTVIADPAWAGSSVQILAAQGAAGVLIDDTRDGHAAWYGWQGSAYASQWSTSAGLTTSAVFNAQSLNGLLDAAQFSSLSAACSAAAAAGQGVVIPSGATESITANTTLPSNCATEIQPGGNVAISSGVTLTSNGSLEVDHGGELTGADSTSTLILAGPFSAGEYQAFYGGLTVDYSGSVYQGRAKAAWWGVKANDVTDDTAALNAADASVFSNTGYPVPLQLPDGKMLISGNGVTFGKSGVQLNGWLLYGSSGMTSRFDYTGSGVAVTLLNLQWSHFSDFSVTGTNAATSTGILMNGDRAGEGGGCCNKMDNIYLGGFGIGLQLSDGVHQMGQNLFNAIHIDGSNLPGSIGVVLDGGNVDGEVFNQLTVGTTIGIECLGCAGVTVNGSDSSMIGTNNIFLLATGGVHGPFSLRDLRLEQAAILAWVGPETGTPDPGRQMNLKLDNIYYASTPTQPALTAPGSAPTLTATFGSLSAGTYYIECSALNGVMGETLTSPSSTMTLTSAGGITAVCPPVTGAAYYKFYLSKYASMSPAYWEYSFSNTLTFNLNYSYYMSGAVPTAATAGSRAMIAHYGEAGTMSVVNSDFSAGGPGEFFQLANTGNQNSTLFLDGNKVTNTTPEALCTPQAACVSGLIEVDGMSGSAGTNGGVIYQSIGNQIQVGITQTAPYFAHNKLMRFTTNDANGNTQSVLWDCGALLTDGCAFGGAIEANGGLTLASSQTADFSAGAVKLPNNWTNTGGQTVSTPASAASNTVEPFAAIAHEYLTAIANTGAVTAAQPSAADLSNGTTGSGAVVLASSPALNSPALTAPSIGGETFSASPRMTFSAFIPVATAAVAAVAWTPDKAITVTRLQAQAQTPPAGCSTPAVVQLTDGASPHGLSITAAANDSGPISQNYAAGATLTLSVSTAASGCTTAPANLNLLVQYRMQ